MPYQFTDSVPYLLNWVGVRLGERFSLRLASYDITLPMYRVLATLRQHESKMLTELSEMVSVEISTLSRLVGVLVRRDLVTRVRPEDNARIVQIALTEKGAELADELMPIAAMFEKTAIEGLKPEEIKMFKTFLRHIGRNIGSL
ncbi:MarR family winged helix-turn-helix transcriptional regulator [Rhizobium oryzicola]|uniref:MarR family transcriptional regulator n=1 Tax=Rhizobium oryzicola TaxID=1232668 RepID=A0ABT8SWW2_9HYPH|nr:MarR family transcriptional regulator [Rhizobium oryzicola]MDO1582664.1 MarR family transcriptional regulator [Rhizobium oryzicola]